MVILGPITVHSEWKEWHGWWFDPRDPRLCMGRKGRWRWVTWWWRYEQDCWLFTKNEYGKPPGLDAPQPRWLMHGERWWGPTESEQGDSDYDKHEAGIE